MIRAPKAMRRAKKKRGTAMLHKKMERSRTWYKVRRGRSSRR